MLSSKTIQAYPFIYNILIHIVFNKDGINIKEYKYNTCLQTTVDVNLKKQRNKTAFVCH